MQIANSGALGSGPVTFVSAATLEAAANVSIANAVTTDPDASATFGAAAGDTLTLDDVEFTGGAGTTAHFGSATDTGVVVLTTAGGYGYDTGSAAAVDGGRSSWATPGAQSCSAG